MSGRQRLGKVVLKDLKKSAENMGSRFGKLFFNTQKMAEEEDIRIIPPLANVPGDLPYLPVKVWWIGKKRYVDPSTFGGTSPLQDELDIIKEEASKKELKDIEKLEDSKNFQIREEVLFVGFVFNFDINDDGLIDGLWLIDDRGDEMYQDEADDFRRKYKRLLKKEPDLTLKEYMEDEGYEIVKRMGEAEPINFDKLEECVMDGGPKIIKCGVSMAKAIIAEFGKRGVMNNTDLGILDRVEGYNITLLKTGKELKTKYEAMHHRYPMELPESMFDHKDIPDIVEITKKELKSEDHLRSVIRNYFLGEDIIPDENDSEEDGTDNNSRSRRRSDRTSNNGSRRSRRDDEYEEDDSREIRSRRRKDIEDDEHVGRKTRSRKNEDDNEDVEDTEKSRNSNGRSVRSSKGSTSRRTSDKSNVDDIDEDQQEEKLSNKRSSSRVSKKSNKEDTVDIDNEEKVTSSRYKKDNTDKDIEEDQDETRDIEDDLIRLNNIG